MDKHKLDKNNAVNALSPDRAPVLVADDGTLQVQFIGKMTAPIIRGLIAELKSHAARNRRQGRPVHILIDISQITGHDSASRVAGKQAVHLDFDRGAAYGGTVTQGLVMQYLQRSINPGHARYFRTRAQAEAWLRTGSKQAAASFERPNLLPVIGVAAILVFVLVATYAGWRSGQNGIAKESSAAFTNRADATQAGLQKRIQVYVAALYGFRGLYAASDGVDRDEFRAYFRNLSLADQYPGFSAISYAQRVTSAQKATYLKTLRQDTSLNPKGYPAAKIFPDVAKPEYYVLTYNEPSGESNLGFDLSSDSGRRTALMAARDSGQPTATKTIELISAIPAKGFLVTLPLYRTPLPATVQARQQELTGFVNAVFNYRQLFEDALVLPGGQDIAVAVRDAAGEVVFTSGESSGATDRLRLARTMEVGGQRFTLDFSAPHDYGLNETSRRLPVSQLAGGLSAALLVVVILWVALRSRSRAIALARAMTEDLESERNQAIAAQHKLERTEAELKRAKANVEQKVIERTRELTQTQAQLIASIQSLPFGFAVVDPADRIMFANSKLAHLTGEAIPTDPDATPALLHRLAASYTSAIDLLDVLREAQTQLKPFDKTVEIGVKFFRFYILPITLSSARPHHVRHARAIGAVVIIADVTEEKALQRSRDEFFSIASHELRTPITAIRGNISMMLDMFTAQLSEPMLHEMVKDTEDASDRLGFIVDTFLDMSRLEQGQVAFKTEAVDLEELARQTIRQYQTVAKAQHLELKLEIVGERHVALADSNRLHQIVASLMSNAIQYTQAGSITLHLQAQARTVKFSVTDTGQGIAPKFQHLLFRKFQQATDSILTRDGSRNTGLGLYISRLIAQGMRGKLTLERTEVGHGSTFSLVLPKK